MTATTKAVHPSIQKDPIPLEAKEFDFELLDVTLTLSWHVRRENSPLHRWMRDILVSGAKNAPTAL